MQKYAVALMFSIGLVLCGCGSTPQNSQSGPYGEISLSLPDGWSYELCPADSDKLMSGMYGMKIYPNGVDDGYIEVDYIGFFGVCGTGLAQESTTIAGKPANIGTYDNCEDVSEREIDWGWLYGELEPGEYRIEKSIDDFIESGNYEKYMIYAHFVLN